MAQIPTSSITMAAIKTETGASATGTLADCKNASIAFVMTSTSVPGHTRDGNEQTNTTASPWYNTMAEWAGYTHTQNFPSATYHSRLGTTVDAWAARTNVEHDRSDSGTATAAGGIHIFQREISGDTVFQAEAVTGLEAGSNVATLEDAEFVSSAGNTSSFGSYSNHDSPVSIITIPGVVGITASLSASPLGGYSHTTYPAATQDMHSSMAALSGFVGNIWHDSGGATTDGPLGGYGALKVVDTVGQGVTYDLTYTQWTITLSKAGYNNATLTTFSTKSRNWARSTSGGGCFVYGTQFRMADGSLKEVQDIFFGDIMELGGEVDQMIIGNGKREEWYDVNGVYVTGTHTICKDGEWMRVRAAGYPRIATIDQYYVVANQNHRMVAANGQVFGDYTETDFLTVEFGDWLIDSMNGKGGDLSGEEWLRNRFKVEDSNNAS